jgi:hypothetical protein
MTGQCAISQSPERSSGLVGSGWRGHLSHNLQPIPRTAHPDATAWSESTSVVLTTTHRDPVIGVVDSGRYEDAQAPEFPEASGRPRALAVVMGSNSAHSGSLGQSSARHLGSAVRDWRRGIGPSRDGVCGGGSTSGLEASAGSPLECPSARQDGLGWATTGRSSPTSDCAGPDSARHDRVAIADQRGDESGTHRHDGALRNSRTSAPARGQPSP